ncbi:MAG: hypothetical protein J6R82_02535 [Clostridia bacterium]|nr:hypothetical protein [Clostridia bacterium]
MKLFTKCLPLLLAALLTASALLTLSACGTRDSAGDANPDSTSEGTTTTTTHQGGTNTPENQESLKSIYDKFMANVDAEFPSLVESPVDKDNFQYYFGIQKTNDISSTFVSEPMMGAIPFGISMARVADGADAAAIAAQMKAGVDPRRWVCVTASFVEVAVKGNVIILVLDDDSARGEAILNAFKNA